MIQLCIVLPTSDRCANFFTLESIKRTRLTYQTARYVRKGILALPDISVVPLSQLLLSLDRASL